jgi:hypothetical protein
MSARIGDTCLSLVTLADHTVNVALAQLVNVWELDSLMHALIHSLDGILQSKSITHTSLRRLVAGQNLSFVGELTFLCDSGPGAGLSPCRCTPFASVTCASL